MLPFYRAVDCGRRVSSGGQHALHHRYVVVPRRSSDGFSWYDPTFEQVVDHFSVPASHGIRQWVEAGFNDGSQLLNVDLGTVIEEEVDHFSVVVLNCDGKQRLKVPIARTDMEHVPVVRAQAGPIELEASAGEIHVVASHGVIKGLVLREVDGDREEDRDD